jgi:flavoprotein
MSKLTGFIASAVLTAGMGAANAGETPQILSAVDYRALYTSEMASITGENRNRHRNRIKIANRNTNTNVNFQQQAQCVALCAGGNLCPSAAAEWNRRVSLRRALARPASHDVRPHARSVWGRCFF